MARVAAEVSTARMAVGGLMSEEVGGLMSEGVFCIGGRIVQVIVRVGALGAASIPITDVRIL
jgi:hypothetical protein